MPKLQIFQAAENHKSFNDNALHRSLHPQESVFFCFFLLKICTPPKNLEYMPAAILPRQRSFRALTTDTEGPSQRSRGGLVGTFRLKTASQKAKVQLEQGVVSPMNRKSIAAISFLLFVLLSAPCSGVVIDSDLTAEEKEEIAIDDSVAKAEKRRLEIILAKIRLHLLADEADGAAELFRRLAVVYPAQDDITKSRITRTGYSVAYALAELEKSREALKFADELLQLIGDDSIVFHIKGIAFDGLGKTGDAEEWKHRAFSHKLEDEEYRFQVAQFFFNQRNYG